jgi:hypothetical protein
MDPVEITVDDLLLRPWRAADADAVAPGLPGSGHSALDHRSGALRTAARPRFRHDILG